MQHVLPITRNTGNFLNKKIVWIMRKLDSNIKNWMIKHPVLLQIRSRS